MSKIESVKTYSGNDLESTFFIPMLTGMGVDNFGVRVLYNMPTPTTMHFWHRTGNVLQKYGKGAGWAAANLAQRYSKTIDLARIKAEMGYSADEYFSLVCDNMTKSALGRTDDLSGTDLEAAETALFKESITESLRATMWLGSTSRSSILNTFDGFVKRLSAAVTASKVKSHKYAAVTPANVEACLKGVWDKATDALKSVKSEGELVFYVTSDVYYAYEESLGQPTLEAAYLAKQNGVQELTYRGIPLVDLRLNNYLKDCADLPASFVILTDKRNLTLAVNTSDFPGTEVRMWYNPDIMENRQRAVFMAGCDFLMDDLVVFGTQTA